MFLSFHFLKKVPEANIKSTLIVEIAIQKPHSATFVSRKYLFQDEIAFSGPHDVCAVQVTYLNTPSDVAVALPNLARLYCAAADTSSCRANLAGATAAITAIEACHSRCHQ